jgi:hypothetical protein
MFLSPIFLSRNSQGSLSLPFFLWRFRPNRVQYRWCRVGSCEVEDRANEQWSV